MRTQADATRTRATSLLFASVAVGNTSFVASITVSPLVGHELSHSATLSGIPWSAATLGVGISSFVLSRLMASSGRLTGLVTGYIAGAVGAAIASAATIARSFAFFVVGVVVMGAGNAANHLSRYAAADMYPPDQRAAGLGKVVWASTVGGVAGPSLLAPAGGAAVAAGLTRLSGPMLMTVMGFVLAIAVLAALARMAPGQLRAPAADDGQASSRTVREMWRAPGAQVALISLAAAQAVMVLIMAMTPLHMRMSGHGLGPVGVVIAVHVFAMYGLSPISGRLTDRFGSVRVIMLGFAVLVAAAVTAAAVPAHSGIWLTGPLFLLGIGWSFAFVAGSALLTRGLAYADRTRLQGATDAVVWTAAAVAGLGSGILIGAFSYAMLCIVGAVLVALPFVVVAGQRRTLATAA